MCFDDNRFLSSHSHTPVRMKDKLSEIGAANNIPLTPNLLGNIIIRGIKKISCRDAVNRVEIFERPVA